MKMSVTDKIKKSYFILLLVVEINLILNHSRSNFT